MSLPTITPEHAKRLLVPGGVYVVNSGDAPALSNAREDAATIAAAFKHTVIIADPAMLKGRRYGNMIIAGSDAPFDDDPGLARRLLGGAVPAHLWDDPKVRAFAAGAAVRHDAKVIIPEAGPEAGPASSAAP